MDSSSQFLAPLLGGLSTIVLTWIGKNIADLSKHVQALNEKMVLVVEKVNSHEKRLARLESEKKRGR